MSIICGSIGKCKKCNHFIFLKSNGEIHHFTRIYHSFGYPYTTKKCYAGLCKCEKPEINFKELSEREIEIIKTVQKRRK